MGISPMAQNLKREDREGEVSTLATALEEVVAYRPVPTPTVTTLQAFRCYLH